MRINSGSSDSKSQDYRALAAVLQRTGSSPWDIELTDVPQALLDQLDGDPARIEALARDWEALGRPLPRRAAAPPPTGAREELPAQAGWVRVVALSLEPFAALQQAVGVDARQLSDLVDRDPLLRALQHWAGRAKDGAMDLRALLGAYGWFQISLVLTSLRRRLRTLDEAGQQRLLADFAPMLTLLAQSQEAQAEGRATSDAAFRSAVAEAEEAEAQATQAETRARLRRGEPVPEREARELLKAERQSGPALAARAPRRRPGAPGGRTRKR